MTSSARVALAVCAACAAGAGCAAPPYEVRGTYAPNEAASILKEHESRAWVVRGSERTELAPGARIEPRGDKGLRVTFPSGAGGVHVRKLEDGDAIVVDEEGRIVAIRSKAGVETHFAPGTASLPPGSDEVLVMQTNEVLLEPADKIELLARYGPGDKVPGAGHIEERRKLAALVGGGLLAVMGYGPAFYVGATSPLKIDRALLVPVLGPWIDLLGRPKCATPNGLTGLDPCAGETAIKVGLVSSALAQAAGAVLIGLGLPAEAILVKDDAANVRVGPWGARGEF